MILSAEALCTSVIFAQQYPSARLAARDDPNVLLVIIDDMGWKQLGCYGSNYYKTPNIDKFSGAGVMFSDAYSSAPVSSPTRAALMTGKHPARLHITDYIPGNNVQDKNLKVPEWQKFLPLEETTIAEVMKTKGYRTALFGKWHLSREKFGDESLPHNPDRQGFDESFLTYKPSPGLPLGSWQVPEMDGHSTDTITSRATDFIARNTDHPFLLVVSYDAIHDPLMEKENTIRKYRDSPGSQSQENNPVLAAMIERVDNSFGRLIDCLTRNYLLENTIIVVLSDNGGLEKSASQIPLKEGKGWLYEGGIRVPLIISWKGQIREGAVSDAPVASIDIMPTIIDLADIRNNLPMMDGISLVPVLKENQRLNRDALFWNYPHYHNGPPCAVIRKGNFKMIEWYEKSLLNSPGAYELYDLSNDIGENKNLVNELPGIVSQLKDELSEWRNSVDAQIPSVNKGNK